MNGARGPDPPGALIGGVMRHLHSPDLTCTIVLATRPEGGATGGDDGAEPVELSYMDVDRDSVAGIVADCIGFVEHRRGWDEVPLDLDADNEIPLEEYHVIASAEVPFIELHTARPRNQIEELGPNFVSRLKSLQVRLQTRKRTVIFFRKYTKGKVLSQGKKLGRLTNGKLRLSKETLIELPGDYDCCLYEDVLAVFNRLHFEDIFGYRDYHLSLHEEVFEGLANTGVTIERLDEIMEQTRNDKRKLRKFGSIRDKGMYQWDFDKIEKFLKRRNIPRSASTTKRGRSHSTVHRLCSTFTTTRTWTAGRPKDDTGPSPSRRSRGGG